MLTRTNIGDLRVMIEVAAFMMIVGTLASFTTSATASAFGVNAKPVRNLILSRSTSSSASCFDLAGFGPPTSR